MKFISLAETCVNVNIKPKLKDFETFVKKNIWFFPVLDKEMIGQEFRRIYERVRRHLCTDRLV